MISGSRKWKLLCRRYLPIKTHERVGLFYNRNLRKLTVYYVTIPRCESSSETIPRRWQWLAERPQEQPRPKLTREASTSVEDLTPNIPNTPGIITRPKSMCMPDMRQYSHETQQNCDSYINYNKIESGIPTDTYEDMPKMNLRMPSRNLRISGGHTQRQKQRRNPVQRAASRLYKADTSTVRVGGGKDSVGPEFVVRAALPSKQYIMPGLKSSGRKTVTVIMLNGQKLDVVCNMNSTTAGQLFEVCAVKNFVFQNREFLE